MEYLKMAAAAEEEKTSAVADGGGESSVVVELPLGAASASSFDLEKAVCSHGLFMMAPNHWDPLTKTLNRPLRLDDSTSSLFFVCISHPSDTPLSLHIRVFGTHSLSPQHLQSLLGQVRRMLRLSDVEERNLREFQQIYGEAKERGFGRVFRSPTLFEDMVKCILLCNCSWPRTLSMATALCELQLELQCPSFSPSVSEGDNNSTNSSGATDKTEHFIPNTPIGKESKRKLGVHKCPTNLKSRFSETKAEMEAYNNVRMECVEISESLQGTENSRNEEEDVRHYDHHNSGHVSNEIYKAQSHSHSNIQSLEGSELYSKRVGNFPSPLELASLDENFLRKRCKVGYRASRIVNLAKSVVEGKIQLSQLEEACEEPSLSNYNEMEKQLKEINGFGSFTCANVLMCMGFYHVIPTDSETVRHLKKVHARNSTIQRVERDVEAIYGKYAPFQFLVYWSEIWHFYEETFGKLSEMPHSEYKLITATNMRPRANGKNKRTKKSR